jgi:ATP adenylyltransferase
MAFINGKKPQGCVFCQKAGDTGNDKSNFVIWRGNLCFAILNLYPYTTGHAMIIPYRHVGSLTDLTDAECSEIFTSARDLTVLLSKTLKPDGFNLGMNLGKVAGAGIADHVHLHIVPRWEGDSNFMPVVGGVKVHPTDLETIYSQLMKASVS